MSSGQRHHRTRTHLAEAVPDFRRHGIDRLHLRLDYERKQTLRRACPDLHFLRVNNAHACSSKARVRSTQLQSRVGFRADGRAIEDKGEVRRR